MAGPLFPATSSLLTHYAPQRYLNWYMRLGALFSLVFFFFFCFTFFWLLRSVFSLFVYSSGLLGPAVISLVLRCSSEPLVPPLTLAALAGLGAVSCLSQEAKSQAKSQACCSCWACRHRRWPRAALRLGGLSLCFANGL